MDGGIVALLAQTEPQSGPSATDWIDAGATIVQSLAIVAGGIWAYLKFVRGRLNLPRASLKHQIVHYQAEDCILLHVNTVITNPGSIVLNLLEGLIRVQQVLPLKDPVRDVVIAGGDPVREGELEVRWPRLGERRSKWADNGLEIEPGETDEVASDFLIPRSAGTIVVYTHFENAQKKRPQPIGWGLTSLYELKPSLEMLGANIGLGIGGQGLPIGTTEPADFQQPPKQPPGPAKGQATRGGDV